MNFVNIFLSTIGTVALALTLISCSGVKPITAEPPKDQLFRTELKKEPSSINVTFETTSDDISKALNRIIGREIYKGSTKTKGLSADILKNGPITVSASENYIYLTLPITMSLSYGMFETPWLSAKLKFRLTPNITADWRLNTEIYYMGLVDLFAEEVRIGPLSIKPRSIIDGITQPVQKVVSDLINKSINDRYPIKAQIANAWLAAQKPVLLDKNYKAWLKMAPQEVILYPFYARDNLVRFNLGLNTFAEITVGPEPATPALTPLPKLRSANKFEKNFKVTLNADLFFKDIMAIASPLLLNKEFASDGKIVIIKNFDMYGNGDELVIKLETIGSLDGIFYLKCKPLFDPKTNIFSVDNVDFDMQTESLLLKSADWFLHGTIKGIIQEKLTIDLTPKLQQLRETATQAMTKIKLAESIIIKGDIATIKFNDILVGKDKISIQVLSEGETSILFKE